MQAARQASLDLAPAAPANDDAARPAPQEILGVDPGKTGALALLDPVTGAAEVFDMPVAADGTVDVYTLGAWVDARAHRIARALLEYVNGRRGEGHSFAFGRNVGDVRGVLGANFIPMSTVPPAKWKRAMGVTKDKNSSRAKATELFPALANKLLRVKDDGRAEALLIAGFAASQVPA